MDVELLVNHRRNADLVMNPHPMFPHPVAGPPAFDHYVAPGILDGPGAPNRFPQHLPFSQPHMPPQAMPPQMVQGYPGPPPPPRLQHHHSAPSGSMPIVYPQMLMEQEFASVHRPGSGVTHQGAQLQQAYPPGGSTLRNRRSLSPVPLHPISNGSSSMGATLPSMSGSKPGGRSAMPGPGPSSVGLPDAKRADVVGHGMDQDVVLMERDRRIIDYGKHKERERRERDRVMEIDPERHELRREQEREPHEFEREPERPNHAPHAIQRHPSHQYHSHPSQGGHVHPSHNHHHHHHHVLHNHAGAANGMNSSTSGQSQLPGGQMSTGIGSAMNSPPILRESEAQRQHIGVPAEVIDLHSSMQSTVSLRSLSRKGNDEQLVLHAEAARERARPPIPHERSAPPFVSPSMQPSGASFPPSPRTAPQGHSTAPASVAPSRRGSWSASDGAAVPRPSSSASAHLPPLPVSQRLPVSSLPNRTTPAQLSPTAQPHRSPTMLSSPRNGVIRLPPLSSPQSTDMRSPTRSTQPPPGPPLPGPTASGILSKPVSPKTSRRTPPPATTRPKSPLTRERSLSGTIPPSIPPSQKLSRKSPTSIFPAPVSQPTPLPSSRLPNVGTDSDANLVPTPLKVNAVPVD